MSKREIVATEVLRFPISYVDRNNVVAATPTGVTYKVASGNPAQLEAVLGTMDDGSPAAVVRPLVMGPADVSFSVADSLGGKPVVVPLAIVSSALSLSIGVADAVSSRQEAPVANTPATPANDPKAVTGAQQSAASQQQMMADAQQKITAQNAARKAELSAKSPRTPAEEEELAKLNQARP